MPYIKQELRPHKDSLINSLFVHCNTRGDINYCCTKLVHLWAIEQMKKVESLTKKYKILNDAYGIMCSAAAEFYSAVVAPYEKLKRRENGPVSQLDKFVDGKIIDESPKYQCNKCSRFFVCPKCEGELRSECPHCGSQDFDEI